MAYLVVAGLGVALLTASVVRGLFFAPPADAATQIDLAECERDLSHAIERMRSEIPARLADRLKATNGTLTEQGHSDRHSRIPGIARTVARCMRSADSPADRAIREAADALGALESGFRQLESQFEHDVAGPMARADKALIRARVLIGQEGVSP